MSMFRLIVAMVWPYTEFAPHFPPSFDKRTSIRGVSGKGILKKCKPKPPKNMKLQTDHQSKPAH
jgi:hypothetical protein